MSLDKDLQAELQKTAKKKASMGIGTKEHTFQDGYTLGLEKALKLYKNQGDAKENMLNEITKVAKTVQGINKNEFSKKILILYIHDKTKLGKQKIEMILDVINEFAKEMKE